MRQQSKRHQAAAERIIKDIRRRTRKHHSSEEKWNVGAGWLQITAANAGAPDVIDQCFA